MPTLGGPESDGTAVWDATTMIVCEVHAGRARGLGYSYADAAAARVIEDLLADAITGVDAIAIPTAMDRMLGVIRNHGRPGLAACAVSAVDNALWDLKARLYDVSVAELLGPARTEVPVYASGGFTSRTLDELEREVASYAQAGHTRVKIKIGRDPSSDLDRVKVARAALGPDRALMVDANGAYDRKQALLMAEQFAAHGVVWFEEPVSSDDLEGLKLLRDRAPAGMQIAAGEYGYDSFYFRRMLDASAVDVLQADATRCLGTSGFLRADALCDARGLPLSSHCAPALHAHAGAAAVRLVHLEHFFDHVRMEGLLFDGVPMVSGGVIAFDPRRPGFGLALRREEARRHAV
ncbi:MAG TPA: enolase C-terminal domain-like protein [Kofleriaceae bacterium]|nr:enolase C-terminal domain-like protein [Kofleriaceae bacterium]